MKKVLTICAMAVLAVVTNASAMVNYNHIGVVDSIGTANESETGTTVFTFSVPGADDFTILKFYFQEENFIQIVGAGLNRGVIESYYYINSLDAGQNWGDFSSGENDSWGNLTSLITMDGSTPGMGTALRGDPTYIPFYVIDKTDGLNRYGYIELAAIKSGSGSAAQISLQLEGWAYETAPNTYIPMGAVPEPATMALLGLGGLMIRRRKA